MVSRSNSHRAECGAFMIPLSVLVLTLLLMVVFVIDIGSIYRARTVTQKAVDAGVIRSLELLPSNPENGEVVEPEVAELIKQVVYENLKTHESTFNLLGGLPEYESDWFNFQAEWTDALYVDVSTTLDVTPYFGKMLLGFDSDEESGSNILNSTASGKRSQLAVGVLVDNSMSMRCPVEGECSNDCMSEVDESERESICAAPYRIQRARSAVLDFVEQLRNQGALVRLVQFSSGASPISVEEISGLRGEGLTNISEALQTGKNRINLALEESADFFSAKKILVLLSDGSPTLGAEAGSGTYNTRERQQLGAIEVAERIRIDEDFTIYSIGYGDRDLSEDSTNDAFLNAQNTKTLKSFFLRRLSNDWLHFEDPQFPYLPDFAESSNINPGMGLIADEDNLQEMFDMVLSEISSQITD